MKTAILLRAAFSLLPLIGNVFAADQTAQQKPNVVFIMADDLGWRDLGCYGSTFHQTPNLDKLAARGVRFTQAYAANPLCSPTRSSILTGLWPARTGITAPACHLPQVVLNKGLTKGSPKQRVLVANSVTRLKTDYVTLPKLLHAAGYRTGHFGKWHLGVEPYSALQHGFDVDWPHWPGPGPAGSYVAPWKFPATLKVNGQPGEHIEDLLSSQVVEFIRKNKDRPFFVNYWQFSVHAPYDAKDELVAKYRKLADPRNPQRNPVYAAMVESLDAGVGRVLDALDECGLAEKTIIVFFSDNGGVSWAGKGGDAEHKSVRFQADMTSPPTSNLPLRNGKASLYEGGVREPCLVVWPGVTKAGSVNDTVIQSIDWMPTLLDMASVPLPKEATPDGVSLAPLLKGGTLARDAIFTHFPHDTPASGQHPGTSVRRGDWKLIRLFAQNDDGSDQFELYNLSDDLAESKNRAAENPKVVSALNALITDFLTQTDAVIPRRNPAYRVPHETSTVTPPSKTNVSIVGDAFHINDRPTYAGRTWNGKKIEGLLLNSRMVQATFDDLNPQTRDCWAYPDTKVWDADRNLREFLAAMPEWRKHGLLAITLNLQGGSPQGYSKDQPWHNSGFTETGALRPEYIARLEQVLARADELGMVVIVGYFYFGQDQRLKDESAVTAACDAATNWLLERDSQNVLVEVNNECNVKAYDHDILKPARIHELIDRVRNVEKNGRRLLVGTSYGGGSVPMENVVRASDFLLLHGNGENEPTRIAEMVRQTREVRGFRPMPILFNEDDHFEFDQKSNNFLSAIGEYASWGYFDYRMKDEGFDDGYQSVPVNWGISSIRKQAFFELLSEITGEKP